MAPTRKVEVAIVGDATSIVRAFNRADKAAGGFGKKGGKLAAVGMGILAGGAAGATLAIGQGLSAALRTGISEFSQQAKASAQTAAALKSTGNAAGTTTKHIEAFAGALQKQTGLQDDAIQGAQNLLLTFTKISNAGPDKIFDRATRATADLSVALGKDMNGSAMMLGKALNDPIKGISALGRAGVQFTATQKDTIKALVASGDVAGAQKMILKELETQVGGSAKAFGETMPGQIEKAKRAFENLSEGVVAAVAPVVAAALPSLTAAITSVSDFFEANMPRIKETIRGVVDYLRTNFGPQIEEAFDATKSLVASVVSFFRANWPTIKAIVMPVLEAISTAVSLTIGRITDTLKILSALLRGDFSGAFEGLVGMVSRVFNGIVGIIRNLATAAGNAALANARAIGQGIGRVGEFMVDLGGTILGAIAGAITGIAGAVVEKAKALGSAIVSGIVGFIRSSGSAVKDAIIGLLPGPVAAVIGKLFNNEVVRFSAAVKRSIKDARSQLVQFGGTMASLAGQRKSSTYVDPVTGKTPGQLRAEHDAILQDRQRADLQAAIDTAEDEKSRAAAIVALSDYETEARISNAERTAEAEGRKAEEGVNNLVARFNLGLVSADAFRTQLTAIIGADMGNEMGEAFQVSFQAALTTILDQAAKLGKAGMETITGAAGPEVTDPRATDLAERKAYSEWQARRDGFTKALAKASPFKDKKARAAFVQSHKADDLKEWLRENPAPAKPGSTRVALALGGITQGPTNAMIGEAGAEAVIPLDGTRARRMLRGSGLGGTVINLTLNGVLDAKDAARILRPELDRLVRLAV